MAAVTIGEIQALATLKDRLSPKLEKLDSRLKKVGGKAGTVGKMTGGLSKMGLAGGPAVGAVVALAGAASAFALKGLQFNKQIETATTRFIAFTGSAEAAEKHVRRLTKFAAETPFQLPGILSASRQLKTFGADAIYGRDTLRLIGDAAAGVGQPLQDVSMWVGRMYTSLKAGQPIGEATARLQEMGLLSGPALTALREMAKEGGNTEAAMELLRGELGKHDGAMKRLSETTEGLESTFADLTAQSAGVFADAIGLTDTYKQGLKVVNGMLGGMINLLTTPIPRESDPPLVGGMSVSEWRAGLKEVGKARKKSWEEMHAEYLRKQKEYALAEKNEAERLATIEADRVAKLKVDRFWAKATAEHKIQMAVSVSTVQAAGVPLYGGMGDQFGAAFNAGFIDGPGGVMTQLPPGMELVGGESLQSFDNVMKVGAKWQADEFSKTFLGGIANKLDSFFKGKFGSTIMSGMDAFANGDWKAGISRMADHVINFLPPGFKQAAQIGKKILGALWKKFKKPSDAELAARQDVDDYEREAISGLSESQIAEAKSAGWASWEDAAFLIKIRDMYTAAGKSAAEAEADVKRYWDAIKNEDMDTIDGLQKQWDDLGSTTEDVNADLERDVKLTNDEILLDTERRSVEEARLAKESADAQVAEVDRVWKHIQEKDWRVRVQYQNSGGGIPGRAAGGPVSAGAPYVVGERGPELFVPSSNGNIVPNSGGHTAQEIGEAVAAALRRNPPTAVVGRQTLLRGLASAGSDARLFS